MTYVGNSIWPKMQLALVGQPVGHDAPRINKFQNNIN